MTAFKTTFNLTFTVALLSSLGVCGCVEGEEMDDFEYQDSDDEFRLSGGLYPRATPAQRDAYWWCIVGQNHDSVWWKVHDTTLWSIAQYQKYAGINFLALPNYDCSQGVEQLKVYNGGDMSARGSAPDEWTVKLELSGGDAVQSWGLKPDGDWYHARIDGVMLHEMGHHLGYIHAMVDESGDGDTYSIMHYPGGANTSKWWGGAYAGQDKDWEHHRRFSLDDIVKLMLDYPAKRIHGVSIDGSSFSEETPRRDCPSNKVMIGLECSGSYCDNKRLICGIPSASSGTYTSQGSDLHIDPYQWLSGWFSEENGGWVFSGGWVNGIECSGGYCDNLQLRGKDVFSDSGKSNKISPAENSCYWTGSISEENWANTSTQNYAVCEKNHAVAGVSCSGAYCDNLALRCCEMKY